MQICENMNWNWSLEQIQQYAKQHSRPMTEQERKARIAAQANADAGRSTQDSFTKTISTPTIGYYNYYNNPHRYTPETPQDFYQHLVNQYTGDELKAMDMDPFSEEMVAIRKLEERLVGYAASVREQCGSEDEVRQYLNNKYFGADAIGYTKKWEDPETYAMLENDFQMICYGGLGLSANRNDPRLGLSASDWHEYETRQKATAHKSISGQFEKLLKNNNVELSAQDALQIQIDPYSFGTSVHGSTNGFTNTIIAQLLNGKGNSKNLLYWAMNNSAVNQDAVAKMRAWHEVNRHTGLDLRDLHAKDGFFLTPDGRNILDLVKEGIRTDSTIQGQFKDAAFEYIHGLVSGLAAKGWDAVPDVDLTVSYTADNGFYFETGK